MLRWFSTHEYKNVTLGWRRLAVTKDDEQQGNEHTRSASEVTGEPQYLLTRFRHVAARKQSNGGYLMPSGFGQVPQGNRHTETS